jgi:hypothetical protein
MGHVAIAKMLPPARPVGFISRPELSERISSVLKRRLTVVVAEAGFGKSTLLASWWDAAPCAWYTIDHTDHDLASLVRGLCDALRLRVPQLLNEVGGAFDGVAGPELEPLSRADAVASRLAELLDEELDRDLIVVLDDVQSWLPQALRLDSSRRCAATRRAVSTWCWRAGSGPGFPSSDFVARVSCWRSRRNSWRSTGPRWRRCSGPSRAKPDPVSAMRFTG